MKEMGLLDESVVHLSLKGLIRVHPKSTSLLPLVPGPAFHRPGLTVA